MTDPASAAALIPAEFRDQIAGREPEPTISGDDWLSALPASIAKHLAKWELSLDGPARFGECALVLPVRQRGVPLVLKLTWPHLEAQHEHLALRAWSGKGAVRLIAADPGAYVLLLQRLDGDRDLHAVPILDACETIGELLAELDRPPMMQLPRLNDWMRNAWSAMDLDHPSVPRRMLAQAHSMMLDLTDEEAPVRLINTELHYANVLGYQDNSWLAIDPKPLNGDPAYAVAPAVWNRSQEAKKAHNLRVHLRLRADVVAEAAGLDGERVRMWTFVRLVAIAYGAGHQLPASSEFHGRMIAAAKAFAD